MPCCLSCDVRYLGAHLGFWNYLSTCVFYRLLAVPWCGAYLFFLSFFLYVEGLECGESSLALLWQPLPWSLIVSTACIYEFQHLFTFLSLYQRQFWGWITILTLSGHISRYHVPFIFCLSRHWLNLIDFCCLKVFVCFLIHMSHKSIFQLAYLNFFLCFPYWPLSIGVSTGYRFLTVILFILTLKSVTWLPN